MKRIRALFLMLAFREHLCSSRRPQSSRSGRWTAPHVPTR